MEITKYVVVNLIVFLFAVIGYFTGIIGRETSMILTLLALGILFIGVATTLD